MNCIYVIVEIDMWLCNNNIKNLYMQLIINVIPLKIRFEYETIHNLYFYLNLYSNRSLKLHLAYQIALLS